MSATIRKTFNGATYNVEVWGRFSEEKYKFGIQAMHLKLDPKPFAGWVSEEFIADNIDNNKNLKYLEKILLEIVNKHFEDIMQISPYAVARNIQWWFKEAHNNLRVKQ